MYIRSHVDSDGQSTRTLRSARSGEAIKQVQDGIAYLGDSARPAVQWLEESVRRRPATALAVAAGVGALVAFAVRRLR